jgi:hypothetical protein
MERTASICTAFNPDTTPLKCHEILTNGQPQIQTIHLTGQTRIDPVEVRKNAFPMLISNAQAKVSMLLLLCGTFYFDFGEGMRESIIPMHTTQLAEWSMKEQEEGSCF